MLPPVSSVLSTSTSYQRPMSQTMPSTEVAVAAAPATLPDVGLESSAAARFGNLKLSGSETLADTLVALAETLGKAINLPRREGEAGMDYLLRLSETIKTLDPADQAKVAQQLNQIVQGVKLRLLAEALSNPAGPEAAKLIAVLEMASYKDRDLAARAVVSSYRQNAGAETPVAERAVAMPLSAQSNVSAPAMTQGLQSSTQPGQQNTAAAILSTLAGATPVGDLEESVSIPTATTIANSTSANAPGKELPTAHTMPAFEPDDLTEATAKQASSLRSPSGASDVASGARALQGELQQKLGGQAATVSQPLPMQQQSTAQPSKSIVPLPDASNPGRDFTAVQPALSANDSEADFPSSRQVMLALTEWRGEADIIVPRPVVQPPITAALPPQIGSHSGHQVEAATIQTAAYQPLPFPEHDEFVAQKHDSRPSPAELLSADSQDRLPPDSRAKADADAWTPAILEQQMAQLRSTVVRDGLPLPYIPYPIADEFKDSSGSATDLHRGHGEEEDETEDDASAEEGGDADEPAEELAEVADPADAPPTTEEPDPAYDLYRRMAGWN